MPSYYDIDTILAEEELIQIRPSFPFSHLSHLDPESSSRKRRRVDKENVGNTTRHSYESTALEEGTKIKLPLWAVDRWAVLGFVKVTLPGIYGSKMKERLLADPVSVDLGSKNTHYFLTGLLLTSLLHRAAHVAKRHRSSRSAASPAAQLANLAQSTRLALLTSMMGERLRRNFDWTLSALDNMEDDASGHLGRLSVLERRMFERGVESSGAVDRWREGACGRIGAER